MKSTIVKLLALVILLQFTSCMEVNKPYNLIAPGMWRAELSLTPSTVTPNKKGEPLKEKLNINFDEVTEGKLPFNFEVEYLSDSMFTMTIINGEERILVDDISFGRDRKTGKDTLLANFPEYDSYIKALCEGSIMAGEFVIKSKEDFKIPFIAKFGKSYRFTDLRKKPAIDVSGNWEVNFDINTPAPYNAIGVFKQAGNKLTGTFKTETGDFRYLEGTIQDKKLYLSCFDGAHAFLFEGKIQKDGSIQGSFRSGLSEPSIWAAKRNPAFKLNDPYNITKAKSSNPIDFTFPDENGKMVSLKSAEYKGKLKLIQIMGTWCPNCKDESKLLSEISKEYQGKNLAIIGLSFERYEDPKQAQALIARYRNILGIKYAILHGGPAKREEAIKFLPFLNELVAYPTLLVLDSNDKIIKIHTGFAGPATDEYAQFKNELKALLDQNLKE